MFVSGSSVYRRNICQQFNPKGGGGGIFTYGWGYVIPMVYMSMCLRIFDSSGGWGVVCRALSTNQLFPMTHTGQRVDLTMEQGDIDLYTVSP